MSDSRATTIFASPGKLDLALQCAVKLGIPQRQVFLFVPERSSLGSVKTLGDILTAGEADWERLTTRKAVEETWVPSFVAKLSFRSSQP